jgi:hypothetical protein
MSLADCASGVGSEMLRDGESGRRFLERRARVEINSKTTQEKLIELLPQVAEVIDL